jgi:hypothetical protein
MSKSNIILAIILILNISTGPTDFPVIRNMTNVLSVITLTLFGYKFYLDAKK